MKLDIDFGLFPDIECEVAGERIKYSIFNDYENELIGLNIPFIKVY